MSVATLLWTGDKDVFKTIIRQFNLDESVQYEYVLIAMISQVLTGRSITKHQEEVITNYKVFCRREPMSLFLSLIQI